MIVLLGEEKPSVHPVNVYFVFASLNGLTGDATESECVVPAVQARSYPADQARGKLPRGIVIGSHRRSTGVVVRYVRSNGNACA